MTSLPSFKFSLTSPKWSLKAIWEGFSIYLPIVMMASLALATYWLVRNTPLPFMPEPAKAIAHEPDYFMRRATVKIFDETGRLKSEVSGSEARHYPDSETLEVDQVRVRSIGPDGRVTVSTAHRGLSNDEGTEVQLMGNAVVVREPMTLANGKQLPRVEFRGEFLHVFLNDERVRSHLPVVLIRGADQFTGDQFEYDNLEQVANLKGRVKGVLMPPTSAKTRP